MALSYSLPFVTPRQLMKQLISTLPSDAQQPESLLAVTTSDGRYELMFYPKQRQEFLSEREIQVARLAASGLNSKQIAEKLHISNWTVCTHLRRIYLKMNVSNRAMMVKRLHDGGWLR